MRIFLSFNCQLNHDTRIVCSKATFVPVNAKVAFDTLDVEER